jgi:hypothetical protein
VGSLFPGFFAVSLLAALFVGSLFLGFFAVSLLSEVFVVPSVSPAAFCSDFGSS